MTILRIGHLTVGEKTKKGSSRELISDRSIEFKKGKIHFLVGPNGCGKTTLIRAVMHLLDRDIYDINGDIKLCGKKIWERDFSCLAPKAMRQFLLKHVGFINQDATGSIDKTTQIRNILEEKRALLSSAGVITQSGDIEQIFNSIVPENLRALRHSLFNKYPDELSGGQLQLINMIISLLGKPEMIIADEGFDCLDVFIRESVLKYLLQKVISKNLTLLIVCHDYHLIYRVKSLLSSVDAKLAHMLVHSFRVDHDMQMGRFFQLTCERLFQTLEKPLHQQESHREQDSIFIHRNNNGFSVYNRSSFHLSIKTDLTIPKRKIIGVIGESGTGKTTFARIVAGLLQPKNKLIIDGLPTKRTDLQYTFQIPYSCFNIRKSPFYMLHEGRSRLSTKEARNIKERKNRIFEKLNAGLLLEREEEKKQKSGVFLSGGELQKICLCRPFLWEPELLIFDEPFNNLDPDSQEGLLETIQEATKHATVILILHNIYIALGFCDYIILLKDGEIKYADDAQPLLTYIQSGTESKFPSDLLAYLDTVADNLPLMRNYCSQMEQEKRPCRG